MSTHFTGESQPMQKDRVRLSFTIPRLPLLAGRYRVDLWCGAGAVEEDCLEDAMAFDVENAIYYRTATDMRLPQAALHGPVLLDFVVGHDSGK
jgi:hypothetical protein